ncbi:MAG: acetyl-CoA carboxylase biotin carboxyl carrier protein subunit [Croceitalea sp.]|nr:acetyl-CoA carboxylase biotin carboxyl carrier protein subunit [Croceitalea sp.]
MKKPFTLKVNGQYEFDLSETDVNALDLIKTQENTYHLLHNNQSYHIEIETSNFNHKTYNFKINNNSYQVSIDNMLDHLINEMGFDTNAGKQVSEIHAPMPGLILEVSVKPGQEVKTNDPLLILEAMKMENIITSPRDGIVKSIGVKKGEAIEKKQLLITFEAQ